MESWGFIQRLGLNLDELNLPKINKLTVSSPSGKRLSHDLDIGGFGISRYLLDFKLATLAKQKGVLLLEEHRVNNVVFNNNCFTVETNKGEYTSEICVGSWGKKSNLDIKLKRYFATEQKIDKNYVGVKYHIQYDLPNNLIELHNFKNGYCGISKIENDTCCFCYLTDSENLKKFNGDISKMEERILIQNPFLKNIFSKATFLFKEPIAISNIKIGVKNAVENNILMLGDSAGNIAPLSGNGMSIAMRSSFELNKILLEFFTAKISREELENKYQLFWEKEFKTRIGISKFLQKLLKNTQLSNLAITLLKYIPFLKSHVVKSTHGKPF